MKKVLFTHNDMDGAGCAIVWKIAHLNYPNEDNQVIMCNSGNIEDLVMKAWEEGVITPSTKIYFTDLAPNRGTLLKMYDYFPFIHICDHHKSNLSLLDLVPNSDIRVYDQNGKMESGTSITYKYFIRLEDPVIQENFNDPKKVEWLMNLVENIRSYDTYEWKEANNMIAKRLQALFLLLSWDRFVEKFVNQYKKFPNNKLFQSTDEDFINARLESEQRAISNFDTNLLYRMSVKGYSCIIKFNGGDGVNFSEFSYQFLEKNPDIDVVIGINIGIGNVSFRTNKDIDVAEIFAIPSGGGGHMKAAGALMPPTLREEIMNMIIFNIK